MRHYFVRLVLIAIALWFAGSEPTHADDYNLCIYQNDISACNRLIDDANIPTSSANNPTTLSIMYSWRGQAYMERGDFFRAVADFTNAIKHASGPGNKTERVAAYVSRAEAYRGLKKYDLEAADLTQVIQLHPTDIYYIRRGEAYLDGRNYARAVADFTEFIRLNKYNGILKQTAYKLRADANRGLEKYDLAIADYTEAIRRDPNVFSFYLARGEVYYKTRRNKLAIADFTKAIQLGPKDASAYRGRGVVYLETANYEGAVADLTKAIQLGNRNAQAFRSRGEAHLALKKYDLALADFTEAIKRDPANVEAYLGRADVYFATAKYDLAIADCSEVIQRDPKDPLIIGAAHGMRGESAYLSGKYDVAIADYSALIKRNSENAQLYQRRALAYQKTGDYARVAADLTDAIRFGEKDAYTYLLRAQAYHQLEKYDFAVADFTQAIAQDPQDASFYEGRGDAYAQTGDYGRAIADYTDALRLDANHFTYARRAEAYHRLKQYDLAAADLTEVLRQNPNDAATYEARGDAYYIAEKYQNAIADYAEALRLKPSTKRISQLAWLLATCPNPECRDGARAVEVAEDILTRRHTHSDLDTLAAAYAEAGRFESAVKTQEQVIALAREKGHTNIAAYEYRLRLYQNRTPYHQGTELLQAGLDDHQKQPAALLTTDVVEIARFIGLGMLLAHLAGMIMDGAIPLARRNTAVKIGLHVLIAGAVFFGVTQTQGQIQTLISANTPWIPDAYGPAVLLGAGVALALVQIMYRENRSLALAIWLTMISAAIGFAYTRPEVGELINGLVNGPTWFQP